MASEIAGAQEAEDSENRKTGASPSKPGGGRRGWLIALALLVVLPVFAEIATRVVLRVQTGSWQTTRAVLAHRDRVVSTQLLFRRHPFLHVAPREGGGLTVQADTLMVGEEGTPAFQMSFNSLGYRSPERPPEKPPGVVRIVCVGGSTTMDTLATLDERSWPWRLETELRERGFSVEVWNAGMAGWTSLESLLSLALRDVDLEPDILLVLQGINDLQPAAHQPFDPQYEEGHAPLLERALGFGEEPLAWHERSLLLQVVRDARSEVPAQRGPLHEVSEDDVVLDRVPQIALDTFERNLRSIVAVARAHRAEPILVTSPLRIRAGHEAADLAYLQWWMPWLRPEAVGGELERYNQVVRGFEQRDEALVLDAASEVDWRDEEFGDPIHLIASERFVTYLASEITSQLRAAETATETTAETTAETVAESDENGARRPTS